MIGDFFLFSFFFSILNYLVIKKNVCVFSSRGCKRGWFGWFASLVEAKNVEVEEVGFLLLGAHPPAGFVILSVFYL